MTDESKGRDEKLYVPTPEELEEDRDWSGNRRNRRSDETGADDRPKRRFPGSRFIAKIRKGIGESRSEAQAPRSSYPEHSASSVIETKQPGVPTESPATPTIPVARKSETDAAISQRPPRQVPPKKPEPSKAKAVKSSVQPAGPTKVRRIKVAPEPGAPTKRDPSKVLKGKERAHARATENGHQLGGFTEAPRRDFSASCVKCGATARAVFNVPDGWNDSAGSWDYVGAAIVRQCRG